MVRFRLFPARYAVYSGEGISFYYICYDKARIMRNLQILVILILGFIYGPGLVRGQDPDYRPGLFFREDWKEIPAETPVTQEHVANPVLLLERHGPGGDSIKKSHHEKPPDDPYYIWSGTCTGNWALTLKHKDYFADLTGYAKIKWRSKQAGFRQLHIVVKLADGTWLVSDLSDEASMDWRIREFNIGDIQWHMLNINNITEMKPAEIPDLSKVDQIGFTDLMPGGQSVACSRLDWIEVYAGSVKR